MLYDDTDERPGGKFAKLDLIGLPYQVIVGPKGLASGKVEVKARATGAREQLSVEEALQRLTARMTQVDKPGSNPRHAARGLSRHSNG